MSIDEYVDDYLPGKGELVPASAGHGEKEIRLREVAIAALLCEKTVVSAAGKIGIDESTLRDWMKDLDFANAYRAARRAVVRHATDRLAATCSEAVANLLDVMAHSKSDSSRITASKAVLEYAFKALQLDDLTTRVEQLELDLAQLDR